ncbi:MAG: hypothetical protein ABEJ40_11995 [Haloarculaceae archaeon]
MIDLQSASRTILGVNILFLLLLGLSILVLEPGSASYVVAQLALIPVLITIGISAVVIYYRWSPFK